MTIPTRHLTLRTFCSTSTSPQMCFVEEQCPSTRVGLFVTCLVDLIRPSVGFAAVKLLEDAGCTVEVPVQTCCGQPAFNSGDRATTRADRRTGDRGVRALRLRGGAVRLLRRHAQDALSGTVRGRCRMGAARASVLRQDLRAGVVPGRCAAASSKSRRAFDGTVTYHDSCSGLRELGIKAQPRTAARRACSGLDAQGDARTPMCAAASAARSASNIRTSPTPSSPRRPSTSRRPAPTRCSPAISAA